MERRAKRGYSPVVIRSRWSSGHANQHLVSLCESGCRNLLSPVLQSVHPSLSIDLLLVLAFGLLSVRRRGQRDGDKKCEKKKKGNESEER